MAKSKFYVVWQGVTPGIYSSWEECRAQVSGFEHARYKSFSSLVEAEQAYSENAWKHLNSKKEKKNAVYAEDAATASIIQESIAVDAACSGNPGVMEYRGVYVADRVELFHVGPLEEGTNNIGEFLAIVHALALLQKNDKITALYSDSVNAIKWINRKRCNTKLEQTERNRPVFELIARAEKWLRENSYNNPILKWDTKRWGEIPADFGRK